MRTETIGAEEIDEKIRNRRHDDDKNGGNKSRGGYADVLRCVTDVIFTDMRNFYGRSLRIVCGFDLHLNIMVIVSFFFFF